MTMKIGEIIGVVKRLKKIKFRQILREIRPRRLPGNLLLYLCLELMGSVSVYVTVLKIVPVTQGSIYTTFAEIIIHLHLCTAKIDRLMFPLYWVSQKDF